MPLPNLGANARGVAMIHPTVTDADLKMLANGGIRGSRFSIADPRNACASMEMIERLAERVNGLGWHVQINMTADQFVAVEGYGIGCRRQWYSTTWGTFRSPSG
ncbi:MAG TPA: hypothetical protein VIY49_25815 [Bryobacteraceae bacterium]